MKRSHGICEKCGAMEATEIHHKTYKRIYHEYDKDLIALCYVCHRTEHNKISDEEIESMANKLVLDSQG